MFGDTILPENLSDRKSKVTAFDNGGAMRAPLWAGPHPRDPNEDACPKHKLTYSGSWSWPIPAARRPTYSP